MNKHTLNIRFKILILALLVICNSFGLSSCGRNKSIEKYHQEMRVFTRNITDINSRINSIDVESESAPSELLSCLDELDLEFISLANISVPDKLSPTIAELASDASTHMSEAVLMYREYVASGSADAITYANFRASYDKANELMHYIFDILSGNVPEGLTPE